MATRKKRKKNQQFIQDAIKRPGALTARKKPGESTTQTAKRISKSPNTSAQATRQANFYLNVLKPAANKKKKRRKK